MTLRIDRIRVEGFGRLEDVEHELSPKFNVLYGPNEAGKSTLLGFIRGVLFGFAPQKSALPRYEPERGVFGGELLLKVNGETWSVRREGGPKKKAAGALTIRGAKDELIPESRLHDALAGTDRDLYFQVYAFGLSELMTFDQLAQSGTVSEALMAAGVGGAQRFREAQKLLRLSVDTLWSEGGRTKELSRVLSDLEAVQQRLQALSDLPREHGEATAQIAALKAELSELQRSLVDARLEHAEVERLTGAREMLAAWTVARASLAGFEPALSRVRDGALAALEDLCERRDSARRLLGDAQLELKSAEEEYRRAAAPLPHEASEGELRAALKSAARIASQRESLSARRAASAYRWSQVERAIEGLGLNCTAEELLSKELNAKGKAELLDLQSEHGRAQAAASMQRAAADRAQADRDREAAEVVALLAELSRLQVANAAQCRARLVDVEEAKAARAELARLSAQLSQTAWPVGPFGAAPSPRHPFPASRLWAGLCAVGLLGAGLFALAGTAVAAACTALFAALLVAFQRLASAHHQGTLARLSADEAAQAQERSRRDASLSSLRAERDAQQKRLDAALGGLGLADGAAAEALSECAAMAAEGISRAEVRGQLQRRWEDAQKRLDATANEASRTDEDARHHAATADAILDRVRGALVARGLPQDLSLERALDLWTEASAVQDKCREVRAQAVALAAEAAEHEAVEARLLACAKPLGAVGTVDVVAASVESMLDQAERQRRVRAVAEERLRSARASVAPLVRALEESTDRLAELLSGCGCPDDESLRRAAPRAATRAQLLTTLEQLEAQLRSSTLTAPDEALARVEALGGAAALDALAQRRRGEIEGLDARRQEAAELLGRLQQKVHALEQDEVAQRLRADQERLRAKASSLAERYATDRLALELMERAKARRDKEHQPRLLQLAGARLAVLTAGRYPRVRATDDGKELFAVERDGAEISAEALSRGTREQLYLAFRLAVIEELYDVKGALPVVLDDVLVNFDTDRQRCAARALKELSQTHQVLAFTCHPHLAEVMAEAGAERVDLQTHQKSLFRYGT